MIRFVYKPALRAAATKSAKSGEERLAPGQQGVEHAQLPGLLEDPPPLVAAEFLFDGAVAT